MLYFVPLDFDELQNGSLQTVDDNCKRFAIFYNSYFAFPCFQTKCRIGRSTELLG